MSVSLNGTTGLTFADSSTQNTGGYTGFRNRIINGAMTIDQRNAGASVTLSGGQYLLDRWRTYTSQPSKLSAQQSTAAPTGFTNSLLFTSLSAFTSAATDEFLVDQRIEGINVADLAWGTTNAQPITVSFWVRSSLTGVFSGVIANSGDRNYPFSFIINAANTFEYKSVTIPGDTTGIWRTNTDVGLRLKINLGTGSTYLQPTGVWTSSLANGATGSVSLVGTSGATFYITGVQLEKGSVATPFEFRPYGTEEMLCYRYYYTTENKDWSNAAYNGWSGICDPLYPHICTGFNFPVEMRTKPTVTLFSGSGAGFVDGFGRGQYGGGYAGADASSLSRVGINYINAQAGGGSNVFSANALMRGGYKANAEL